MAASAASCRAGVFGRQPKLEYVVADLAKKCGVVKAAVAEAECDPERAQLSPGPDGKDRNNIYGEARYKAGKVATLTSRHH